MTKWKMLIANSKLSNAVKKEIINSTLYHIDINDSDKIIKAYLYIKKGLLILDTYKAKYFTNSGEWSLIITITTNKTETIL